MPDPLPRTTSLPFAAFDDRPTRSEPLRDAIVAACRRSEPECLPPLLRLAQVTPQAAARIRSTAGRLVERLRAEGGGRGVKSMIHEYSLSSLEGVALMCLAEALLRIPDSATRDALIRDKVGPGDWRAHLGGERTLFVNAATWGLMVTGKLTSAMPEDGLAQALGRLLARGGEPIIRAGMDMAMRMMGEQFVAGETIGEALNHARAMERLGFRYSYDMLGEAATTDADAERYLASYRAAITAIGTASAGRGPYDGPGISVKLSALHSRYRRSQHARMLAELLPRLKALALQAKAANIGFNIDAEESDRLDLSLDLLEALCLDHDLAGWDGLGFVVQAYGKRCPFVIDWLVDLGHRSGHRLMVRLVKGAYWDAEIKQAQVDGLADFPVYTRKVHTDVSYLACARKLLDAPAEVFPQFATHNAQTLASIYDMAGPEYWPGQYEFQCLHGMGEQLYGAVVGAANLDRPCRIYAPVGTHETLLAYLVRRLLENGANTSFVNQIADAAVPMDQLLADPVAVAAALDPVGAPHPLIALPRHILGDRLNSAGLDLADNAEIARLAKELRRSVNVPSEAIPRLAEALPAGLTATPVVNPADLADIVGSVTTATPELAARAFELARPGWAPPSERAIVLTRAAARLEHQTRELLGLIMREAGKSAANALAEIREAVDFLRYYGAQAAALGEAEPLGTVVCISPWNFPLSIFTGQVAAALAAGNAVIAKPAEETPLIAATVVEILHDAGVPLTALQFLPGGGDVGAALAGNPAVGGVVFTGSTEVARLIQRQLAGRTLPNGSPVPLIAETGGINAMVADSSALTEQVVADAIGSAFDSAGQRCSALRLLCVQDDVADRTLAMLEGAMLALRVGNPDRLATDVGPVISDEALERVETHIDVMRAAGHRVVQAPLADEAADGRFVPPTLIVLDRIEQLQREVFGPVLHVVRYARADLDRTLDAINALGYGLTFGLHTRLDETIAQVTARIEAGNIYVNRNIIGAVVGVQPFGGRNLSGTGPKAGGPLYVRRMLATRPPHAGAGYSDAATVSYSAWLTTQHGEAAVAAFTAQLAASPLMTQTLTGPVGERNVYSTAPRGEIMLLPETVGGVLTQLGAVLATGNRAAVDMTHIDPAILTTLPPVVASRIRKVVRWQDELAAGIVVEGSPARVCEILGAVASSNRAIVPVQAMADVNLDLLVHETSVSTNTAAAGGNASLMAMQA